MHITRRNFVADIDITVSSTPFSFEGPAPHHWLTGVTLTSSSLFAASKTSAGWLADVQGEAINQAACSIAKEVASDGDALVAGGICQTPSYLSGKGKTVVQQEFRKQVQIFIENDLDFIICEVCIVSRLSRWCSGVNLLIGRNPQLAIVVGSGIRSLP